MGIKIRHKVTVNATLELDEEQIRALDALAGYGIDDFIEAFYKNLGSYYLKPHESGLRRLFEQVKEVCPKAISDCDKARESLKT